MKVVVLLSGGIDSAVVLRMMRDSERRAIGIDYGQAHAIELEYAAEIAREERVPFQVLNVPAIRKVDDVVFAGRNAVLLSVAASYAAASNFDTVAIGCNKTDEERFPDCRRAFIDAMDDALYAYRVSVVAPLLERSKAEVVALARKLGVAIPRTWSCYAPSFGIPCGECLACTVRREAGA